MQTLSQQRCLPCEGGVAKLTPDGAQELLEMLEDWQMNSEATEIQRHFKFANFHEVMAFANAIAWIAHQENHHPDLELSYNECRVRYSTHAIQGLSKNDFICAAKINALLATSESSCSLS